MFFDFLLWMHFVLERTCLFNTVGYFTFLCLTGVLHFIAFILYYIWSALHLCICINTCQKIFLCLFWFFTFTSFTLTRYKVFTVLKKKDANIWCLWKVYFDIQISRGSETKRLLTFQSQVEKRACTKGCQVWCNPYFRAT